uniref:Uncharacterized protein n=1 Tax=Mycena chlorophos TaxID=658473 RepID=A0ABQ0LZF1_MYCCL|nr:predicted protein [Mycena chlorophos]
MEMGGGQQWAVCRSYASNDSARRRPVFLSHSLPSTSTSNILPAHTNSARTEALPERVLPRGGRRGRITTSDPPATQTKRMTLSSSIADPARCCSMKTSPESWSYNLRRSFSLPPTMPAHLPAEDMQTHPPLDRTIPSFRGFAGRSSISRGGATTEPETLAAKHSIRNTRRRPASYDEAETDRPTTSTRTQSAYGEKPFRSTTWESGWRLHAQARGRFSIRRSPDSTVRDLSLRGYCWSGTPFPRFCSPQTTRQRPTATRLHQHIRRCGCINRGPVGRNETDGFLRRRRQTPTTDGTERPLLRAAHSCSSFREGTNNTSPAERYPVATVDAFGGGIEDG